MALLISERLYRVPLFGPYQPDLVFHEKRLVEVRSYWKPALTHQIKDLPEFEAVTSDLREMLGFLGE